MISKAIYMLLAVFLLAASADFKLEDSTPALKRTESNEPANSPLLVRDDPEPDTPEYRECKAAHNNQRTWKHETHPCNNCWCSPKGTVSCTKMFCFKAPLDIKAPINS